MGEAPIPTRALSLVAGPGPALAGAVRFGPFHLDLGTGELKRDGAAVHLQLQPARVLGLLVRRPGRLVTREELQRHLWGEEVFVDFQRGLNFCIMQIRAALDDDPDAPRFVETLPRRGYRFIAPVKAVGPATREGSEERRRPFSRSPWRPPRPPRPVWAALLLALAALALAAGWRLFVRRDGGGRVESRSLVRVAILPFLEIGGAGGRPMAEGLTEEVIAEAGRIAPGRLGVIARSSVERYGGPGVDLARVKRELEVDFVLEGSVRRSGDEVRVTARLVRCSDQSQVWAETYQRALGDVLDVQREIARSAASGIGVTVDSATRASASPTDPHAESRRLCLLGRRAFEQRTEHGVERARRHFEAALAAAPDYAPAHSGLADVWLVAVDQGHVSPADGLPRAEAEARRALQLDPALDLAHTSIGGLLGFGGRDLPDARRHLERALALNPSNSQARKWYCWILSDSGRSAEALEQARAAALIDPLSVSVVYNLGAHLLGQGRRDEALEVANQLLEIDGEAMLGHLLQGRVLGALGRTDEAIRALQRAQRLDPRALLPLEEMACVQQNAGRAREARAAYAQLVALLRDRPYMNTAGAAVAAVLGEREDAIRLLQAAARNHEPGLGYVWTDPRFDPLRGDPRFAAIERRRPVEPSFVRPGRSG